MRPLVVLFDIDGTLITTGGAGRRALERAFRAHHPHPELFTDYSFSGMTDPAIIREGLKRCAREHSPREVDAVLAAYVVALEEELKTTTVYKLHAGMREAVAASRARANTAVGLGTGNIVPGAKVKLAPLGAYEWFDFGGFGSDHEDRARLIGVGIERGLERLQVKRSDARVVIVGDTPKDIDAAHKNDAIALCVATGAHPIDELRAAGGDFVFSDLAQPGALAALLE